MYDAGMERAAREGNVLLISSGIFHPPVLARLYLWRALARSAEGRGLEVRRSSSIEAIARPEARACRAVVLYLHRQRISPGALEALDAFVAEGRGLLALHSATASFKASPRFTDILGGRFTGHGAVERIDVRPSEPAGIFAGIPPFTVTDELYLHELRADIHVHFVGGESGSVPGGGIPVVWTRTHGLGRVCYVMPGHRTGSIGHPQMKQIIDAGLRWVCAGEAAT